MVEANSSSFLGERIACALRGRVLSPLGRRARTMALGAAGREGPGDGLWTLRERRKAKLMTEEPK